MGKAFGHRTYYIKGDLFQTPYSMTEQLLEKEKFTENIHEPCCGRNAIVDVLKKYNYNVTYSDLFYGENKINFLNDTTVRENIITNPPYGSLTDLIVLHAKSIYINKIAMLLRTNYLSGYKRYRKNVFKELKRVYVFTRMPDLRKELRKDGKYKTGMIVYAWFIWEKGYIKIPTLHHIDNQKYVI